MRIVRSLIYDSCQCHSLLNSGAIRFRIILSSESLLNFVLNGYFLGLTLIFYGWMRHGQACLVVLSIPAWLCSAPEKHALLVHVLGCRFGFGQRVTHYINKSPRLSLINFNAHSGFAHIIFQRIVFVKDLRHFIIEWIYLKCIRIRHRQFCQPAIDRHE